MSKPGMATDNLTQHNAAPVESTPDLHNQLRRILSCLDDLESATSVTDVESAMTLFSQLYKSLPEKIPEVKTLLCTMERALTDTKSAMDKVNTLIDHEEQMQQKAELSVEARREIRKRFAVGPEHGASRSVKQDFLMFADSWFHEVSVALKPYWTQSVVETINTHHQPASDHLGFDRTQRQLMASINHIRLMAGEMVD